jgi:preprotein translocase subunit YajC
LAEQAPTTTAPSSGPTTSIGQPPNGPQGGPPQSGGIESMLVMLVPMFIIFYLLIIRPENKRRKEKESLLGAIKPKDKVTTIGGQYGTVVEIDGDDVILLVDSKKDVKMRFRRSAIDSIETPPQDDKK